MSTSATSPTSTPVTSARPVPSRVDASPESWALAARLAVLLPLALALLLVAFGWPAVRSGPHEVPLGVSGPAPAVSQVEQGLARRAGDAMDLTRYADEAALRRAILRRDVYGGISLTPGGPRLLTATAASPAVAQAITALGTGLAAQQGAQLAVQDVVPLPAEDPRGVGLAAAALPITLGGVVPAVAAVRAFRRRLGLRVATALAVSLVAGATVAAVLRFWFGSVEAGFWPVALGLSLGMAATSVTLVGLAAVAGRVGLGLGAAVVVLLGNPLSGLASAPELLPSGWGDLGQLLPPGASATLLRSTAYFDGAAAGRPAWVLLAWVAVGLALCTAAAVRTRRVHAA
jgi:hypothetical protein